MEEIAEGKGRGPRAFIKKGGKVRAPAADVWGSDHASAEPPPDKARLPKGKTATALPDFVPPLLTKPVDRPPSEAGWGHEIKFDGYRMQLRIVGGKATLKTRKGLDWTRRFPEIAEAGAALPDAVIDGEIVALDAEGAPDFPALQAALSSGETAGLVFYAFDLMFEGKDDLRRLALRDRKARLEALLDAAPDGGGRLRYVEHFETGGEAVLNSACRMHLEGIVSKRLDAPYGSGRTGAWTKAKCRGGQEVVVAGWTSEAGKPFRSLIAGVYRDGRLVHVGRIGTGYGQGKVDDLLPRLKKVETETSPFSGPGAPRKTAGVHWVKPVLVAEIESAGWTGDGNLRQASFKALREDKPAKEVVKETAEPVETVEKAAKKAPAVRAESGSKPDPKPGADTILGVKLSNPDKVFWPADGGEPEHTKRDLALYFEAAAEAILPHIKGRPCSIVRCPDGIDGQRFFQRHAGKGTSSLVTAVDVRGDKQPYLQIDRPEALIAMAQTGALELHPWNCRENEPDTPGRLVFDLDPGPDVPFEDVIVGAREVRDRLQALGMEAFCKTTGGKGLHVVTPLAKEKKGLDWPTAKGFARDLCAVMAADDPDRYLINMAKAKRSGRIFLDYLRNDRLSTAVAPYSPRARPGATVSWPVEWTRVRKGLDPKAFTLGSAPRLLKKDLAWADYADAERSVLTAIARLKPPRAA